MDIFVKKNDTVNVPVYVWEKDSTTEATHDENEAPQDAFIMKFTFRKPGYKDSVGLTRQAQMQSGDPEKMDVIAFQDNVLKSLLVDWDYNLPDGEESLPFSQINIGMLHPSIARAAATGALQKISI